MSDALHAFAQHAAACLAAITDPDSTQTAVDESLAALDRSATSLHGPYRYAAQAVGRCLYQLHSGAGLARDCDTEEAIKCLERACSWPHADHGMRGFVQVGKNLERASMVVDRMPCELRDMKALLRCVIGEVERAVIEMVVVQTQGSDRHAA